MLCRTELASGSMGRICGYTRVLFVVGNEGAWEGVGDVTESWWFQGATSSPDSTSARLPIEWFDRELDPRRSGALETG
jgi:hypothetical protein